jgi:MFS family permease
MGRRPDRPCEYNGLHPSPFQYPLTSRSVNAQLALGNCRFAAAIQHFANDVPARQSYTMAVVAPDERSAAAGMTGITRTFGASLSPALAGLFMSNPALLEAPFFVAGGLKVIYDLLLCRSFRALKAPEEHRVRKS